MCVIAHESPVVVDLPLQDDEQEEQTQQHVAQVADDVVEGAAGGGQPISAPRPTHTALLYARTPLSHLRFPSGWAHRKL